MSDGVAPEDALQVAQRALAKVNDLERDLAEAQDQIDDLEEKLTAARLRLSEHDEERSYAEYTRDDKIGMVREHAFERATDTGGMAALDYHDIKWGVFDGEPSASHCYDLMELAASADGFRVRDPDDGNRQLAADADAAKASRDLLAAKNRSVREGGR